MPTCAEAGLILWLGKDFQTKCLTQDPLTVVSNIRQNVTLRFYTLAPVKHGGFLIKYSVLPASNNATVRLQCYIAPIVSQSSVSSKFPMPHLSQQTLQVSDMNNQINAVVDQGRREDGSGREEVLSPSLTTSHFNNFMEQFPSEYGVTPPIHGVLEGDEVCERISRHEIFVFTLYRVLCH